MRGHTIAPEPIEVVGPPLGHFDALSHGLATAVSSPNRISVLMSQFSFNGIGREEIAVIENRRRRRPKAMRRMYVSANSHSTQRRIQGVFAERAFGPPDGRKHETIWTSHGMELLEDCNRLRWQRLRMRLPRFHPR